MYFDLCLTRAEAQARYRELAMRNHPDRGGSNTVMAEINAAYDAWTEPVVKTSRVDRVKTPTPAQTVKSPVAVQSSTEYYNTVRAKMIVAEWELRSAASDGDSSMLEEYRKWHSELSRLDSQRKG